MQFNSITFPTRFPNNTHKIEHNSLYGLTNALKFLLIFRHYFKEIKLFYIKANVSKRFVSCITYPYQNTPIICPCVIVLHGFLHPFDCFTHFELIYLRSEKNFILSCEIFKYCTGVIIMWFFCAKIEISFDSETVL